MTIENEKRFLLLFSSYVQGNNVTKKMVLDYIYDNNMVILNESDIQYKENRNELVWRNDIAFVKKHLVMNGFMSDEHNNWHITEEGEAELSRLYNEILNTPSLSKISSNAVTLAKQFFSDDIQIVAIESEGFPEGKATYKRHRTYERNSKLVKEAKENFKNEHGELRCEICTFNFKERYGEIGEDFIEAHHIKPVSEMTDGETTKIEDLVMVCSNCHRMLHRKRPWVTIDQLKELIIE